jgi:hypothetical protein
MAEENKNQHFVITPWPKLMDVETAARYLSISPKTIRNGTGRKSEQPFPVKHVKYGRRVLFRKEDLDRFADTLPSS